MEEEIIITRGLFELYEDVRESGVTNMFDVRCVCELSGLERAEVLMIMKNYSEYAKQFGYVK